MTIHVINRFLIRNLAKCLFLFLSSPISAQNTTDTNKIEKDVPFVKVAANPKLKGNGIKIFLVGRNYRKEWTEPVKMPFLSFHVARLTAEKEGGGKETRSLHIKDSAEKKWTLRSVEKFPENVTPQEIRKTVAEKLVEDGISASYPYGALSMGVLSNAAHVPYFKNRLVYLADDTSLGKYEPKYKNLVMLMEQREPSGLLTARNDGEKEKNNRETISTDELVYKLAQRNTNRVDQLSMLKARLLDNFVMDFDRHEGQWEWVQVDSAEQKIYYPVPKDRDQVFYASHGLMIIFVSSKSAVPELQGFRAKAKNINSFNRPEQNLDHYFLNELSEEDWSTQIDALLSAMTDAVIDSALAQQPSEIQKYSTHKIAH